jgi:cobalamin biosynthesis protein CbiG
LERRKIMPPRFAIGVGARRGVDAHELATLVAHVASQAGVAARGVPLYTIEGKETDDGLRAAARLLETELVFLPLAALLARKHDALTRSPRVEALLGVGGVAETAALAGAGSGSILLAPRVATPRLTCAIARALIEDQTA